MTGSLSGEPEFVEFQLIETLRFSPQEGCFLLDAHLERLAASSRHFGFVCPLAQIRLALESENSKNLTPRLLRLLLEASGKFSIEAKPLPTVMPSPFVVLSDHRVNSADPWLAHKTTQRAFYESEYTRLSQSTGCFEVLFCNERDELTEGSRTNLFIEKDGVLLTPPLHCGVLPGTLRGHLLQNCVLPRAREASLSLADARAADRLFVGNSVRGLVEVEFK